MPGYASATRSGQLSQRVSRKITRRDRPRNAPGDNRPNTTIVAQLYDAGLVLIVVMLIGLAGLNLQLAGQTREQQTQWSDRRAFQQEFSHWRETLRQQARALEIGCRELRQALAVDNAGRDDAVWAARTAELQRLLDQLSAGASELVESGTTIKPSVKAKLEQLRAEEARLAKHYAADHPELNLIRREIAALSTAPSETAKSNSVPPADYATDSDSSVKVITNQYLRPVSQPTRVETPAIDPARITALTVLCNQLRDQFELLLTQRDMQQNAQANNQQLQAAVWQRFDNALRDWQTASQAPVALQWLPVTTVQSTPQLSTFGLGLTGIFAMTAVVGLVLIRKRQSPRTSPVSNGDSQPVTLDEIQAALGTPAMALLPGEDPVPASPDERAPNGAGETTATGLLSARQRLVGEATIAGVLAATVLLVVTHGQFGGWLVDNPVSAWGRLWGTW